MGQGNRKQRRAQEKRERKMSPAEKAAETKFDPIKAMGIRKVTGATTFRSDLSKPPNVSFANKQHKLVGETRSLVEPPKTPTQEALERCGAFYNEAVKKHPDLLNIIGSMVNIRRMYAVAYRELQDKVADIGQINGEDAPVEFIDFQVQYAMWLASRQFTEREVIDGMINTVMPWMADTVDKHNKRDEEKAREAQAAENLARSVVPIPIGIKHTPFQEDATISRGKALVLVGWRNAVLWLLDNICESVLLIKEHGFNVVRFCLKNVGERQQQSRFIQLSQPQWVDSCNSAKLFNAMLATSIYPVIGGSTDLVIVDDLSKMCSNGFVGRLREAQAGDAHRMLQNWCSGISAGCVAALPMSEIAEPDVSGAGYEQLKTFAILRAVKVEDGNDIDKPGIYRIRIGTDASVIDVEKDQLDRYGSGLIVPQGF